MRAWLLTATDCACTSLDACSLFKRAAALAIDVKPLQLTLVRAGTTVTL
jgi:hypothetical protein